MRSRNGFGCIEIIFLIAMVVLLSCGFKVMKSLPEESVDIGKREGKTELYVSYYEDDGTFIAKYYDMEKVIKLLNEKEKEINGGTLK